MTETSRSEPGTGTWAEPSEELERRCARTWRLIGLRGLVAIAFGLVLIIWPDIGLRTMVVLVGAFVLVNAVASGIASLAPGAGRDRGWIALSAVVGTAVGIAALVWPEVSAKALLYLIAAWAIAVGLMQVGSALALPLSDGRSMILSLGGIVLVAFGVIMFVEPGRGAIAELALVAAMAIVSGLFDVDLAVQLRNLPDEVEGQLQPQPTTKAAAQG
ncbi:MAG TPA: DUF308 domain-containing protein [Gaiellaceae bacterium]|nr:DUF308 domain-containing protein [Gaiellaceae bacterium]